VTLCTKNLPSHVLCEWFAMQLTAATAAVITKLSSSIHNELALRQFISVGMLLQFESLISCHGDEIGMLEDMDVGMHDLACVRFVVTSQTDSSSTTAVLVSGNRSDMLTSVSAFFPHEFLPYIALLRCHGIRNMSPQFW